MMNYQAVIDFWFNEIDSKQWFIKDQNFDQTIIERYSALHTQAAACELYEWRKEPLGCLAEVIVLDQLSRNIFRDQSGAFATDPLALALAQAAISRGADKNIDATKLAFLYMPFMHSESKIIHQRAVELFSAPGLENNYDYELKHKVIIDRFGRYPHRNAILGRESTQEELDFLQQSGSSF